MTENKICEKEERRAQIFLDMSMLLYTPFVFVKGFIIIYSILLATGKTYNLFLQIVKIFNFTSY